MIKTFLSAMLFIVCAGYGQKAKDLNINHMLRGHIYAASSVKDTSALGGFGSSENMPKHNASTRFSEKGLFLKVDTTKVIVINEKINGYRFSIGNNSDSVINIAASDSRLPVIAQAFINNKWQNIEYLPSSFCGNSFHIIALRPDEYWDFEIPKMTGKIKCKMRYRLDLENNKQYYSNEYYGSINKKQLTEKEAYDRQGIMDPYEE